MKVDLNDPSPDIKTSDWLQWYSEIQQKIESMRDQNRKIEYDINKREDRYKEREEKYREHIGTL